MKIIARIVMLCICMLVCRGAYAITVKKELDFAPATADVFMCIDMSKIHSFFSKRGVPADEIFLMMGDSESRELDSLLGSFKLKTSDIAEIVFVATSSEMKENGGFLLFVKTLRPFTLSGEIESSGEKLPDGVIYPVPKNTGIWFSPDGTVSVIGTKEMLGSYIARKKKSVAVKNPLMSNFIASAEGKTFYGRVDLSQSMRDMMRMGFALGAGKAQGLEKNIFVNVLLNLKSIEYGISSDRDVTFTFGWQAQKKEDGEKLLMVSHFGIVAASLALSLIDVSMKNPEAAKDMEKMQALFGRIRTTRVDNGVVFTVSLTEEELQAVADAARVRIAKVKEDAKERVLREKISVLNGKIRSGDASAVKKLLDEKVPVNLVASDGTLPLAAACETGNRDMAVLLMERGADVNAVSEDGTTPLLAAAGSGSLPLVKFLLEKEADPGVSNMYGETVLHKTAARGDREMLALFIDKEIDVNLVASDGSTALHLAASGGNKEIVNMLIGKGADVLIEDGEGMRASARAEEKGFGDIAKLLREKEKEDEEKYSGEDTEE